MLNVYYKYRIFVASPVWTTDEVKPHPDGDLIDALIRRYTRMDRCEIVRLSTVSGGPWDEVYRMGKKEDISRKRIYEYYLGKDHLGKRKSIFI